MCRWSVVDGWRDGWAGGCQKGANGGKRKAMRTDIRVLFGPSLVSMLCCFLSLLPCQQGVRDVGDLGYTISEVANADA